MKLAKDWQPVEVQQGTSIQRSLDELRLCVHRDQDCLRLSTHYPELQQPAWEVRLAGDQQTITLEPQLPDLVVQAELPESLLLAPRETCRFFLDLPVWLRITNNSGVLLHACATRRLKSTWFGELSGGALEYWAKPELIQRRETKQSDTQVRVPVKVHYEGKQPYSLAKFRIPFPNMTLFVHEGRLWSDRVNVLLREGQQEVISVSGNSPKDLQGVSRLAAPRVAQRRGALPLLQRSL